MDRRLWRIPKMETVKILLIYKAAVVQLLQKNLEVMLTLEAKRPF